MGLLKRNTAAIAGILRTRDRLSEYLAHLESVETGIGVVPIARSAKNSYCQAVNALMDRTSETAVDLSDAVCICAPPETVTVPTIFDFSVVINCRDDSHLISDAFISTEKSETVLMLKAAEFADCFLDIGANIGYYSLIFAVSADAPISVYAFEPAADVFDRFCTAVTHNGLKGTINAFNMALGDSAGEMKMIIHRQGSGGSSLSSGFIQPEDNTGLSQTTQVTTLDTFIRENGIDTSRAVVKIDTEGFEGKVLQGGRSFFTGPRQPVVLIETIRGRGAGGSDDRQVLSMLSDWGYAVFSVGPFIPGVPIITPTFSWGRMKRSKTGNYIAFPEHAGELQRWCRSPEPASVLASRRRITRLKAFQDDTVASINAYVGGLKRAHPDATGRLGLFTGE